MGSTSLLVTLSHHVLATSASGSATGVSMLSISWVTSFVSGRSGRSIWEKCRIAVLVNTPCHNKTTDPTRFHKKVVSTDDLYLRDGWEAPHHARKSHG